MISKVSLSKSSMPLNREAQVFGQVSSQYLIATQDFSKPLVNSGRFLERTFLFGNHDFLSKTAATDL